MRVEVAKQLIVERVRHASGDVWLRAGAVRHKLRAMRATAKPHRPASYVISLRPVGQHGPVRHAAAKAGLGCIALSTMRIVPRDDAATRASLRPALAAPIVIFTSPNAVRAAAGLASLPRAKRVVCAIGAGTAAALRRAGVADVQVPARADSDALLAMPAMQAVDGVRIGLVTAPAGRDAIAPGLRSRGAEVVRADVYVREPVPPTARAWVALRALRADFAIALSSGDALRTLVAHAPADLLPRLRRARVLAGSERLADEARTLGFGDIRVASGARPADLVAAARDGRPRRAIR
jgi:uroporphyrinogen-III synthase